MIVKQKKREMRPILRRNEAMLIGRYAVRHRRRSLAMIRDLQEEEGDHKPSDQVDAEGAVELGLWDICEGGKNARVRDEDSGERHPETAV